MIASGRTPRGATRTVAVGFQMSRKRGRVRSGFASRTSNTQVSPSRAVCDWTSASWASQGTQVVLSACTSTQRPWSAAGSKDAPSGVPKTGHRSADSVGGGAFGSAAVDGPETPDGADAQPARQ